MSFAEFKLEMMRLENTDQRTKPTGPRYIGLIEATGDEQLREYFTDSMTPKEAFEELLYQEGE